MFPWRIAATALAALFLHFPLAAQEPTPGLYDRPILALEPGRHTAPIKGADADAAGETIVTGSDDKTVRLWSAATGALLRTIRVPVGTGDIGKIYAVAISPDGATVAAGGWTRGVAGEEQIYLFDAATGAMTGRIERLPNIVNRLAFSPDGARLAATLGGANGIRLYGREADWAEIARDTEYEGYSPRAAFAPDGRLATTSFDGRLRLYDAAGTRTAVVETGFERPYGVAFDPEGARLAVGFHDTTEVLLYDGRTLAPLPAPDTAGIGNGDLASVAWSADGATLYAGGRYDEGGVRPVLAWAEGGLGPRRALPAGEDTLMSLHPLPGGALLAAAADPWLGVLEADGTPRWTRAPVQADFRDQPGTFAVSADGMVVDFGFEVWGEDPARFDVGALALTRDPPEDDRTRPPEQEALPVTDWVNRSDPKLAGAPLPVKRYEESRSLAIDPDGTRFVLGTEWYLRAFAADGEALWQRATPGTVWAVNITGDGRLAVAAYGDGTIRWHRMEDGVELMALFPMTDGENFVVWTPEGVYHATRGARRVLRWHVNRGWDAAAEAVPVSEIPETHRPEVIPHVLAQMGTAGALAVAELAKIRGAVQRRTRAAVAPGARLHVLAMGVSAYGPKARHLSLDYADDDAYDLAEMLLTTQSGLYAEVLPQRLRDAEVTKGRMLRALDSMRQEMAKGGGNDLAVVHFSGHGALVDDMFYLLPHDVDATDPVTIKSTALAIDVFQREIAKLAAQGRVIVLLDACRSGATTAGGESLQLDADKLRELMRSPNVTVLTSSSADEDSVELESLANGAFTHVVLEALTTRADADRNGIISMVEMTRYLARRVPQLTDGGQTPGIDLRFESSVFVAEL